MRIHEFIDKYCADIIKSVRTKKSLLDGEEFSYDEIIEDPDGSKIKVVYSGTTDIPISDILSMEKAEFLKAYKNPEAEETYDNYVASIIVMEGEEALSYIRDEIRKERNKIESFTEFVDSM